MNYEELAFVNQQLAGMLKSGIPLEGSLKQLCATMRRGPLRTELEALEADLAKGTPLRDALKARQLPEFYRQMLIVGAQANDLPGVLVLLADYYSRTHSLRTRLMGIMVYPSLVLLCAIALSISFALFFQPMLDTFTGDIIGEFVRDRPVFVGQYRLTLWFIPALLFLIGITVAVGLTLPSARAYLRWRLPGFKDAALADLAASLNLLVSNGVALPEAIALIAKMESGTHAGKDLARWRELIQEGRGKTCDALHGFTVLPPLFFWLTDSAGEEVAQGLGQAAEIYSRRAAYRVDLILFAALPVSILLIGMFVLTQVWPIFADLIKIMDLVSG